MQILSKVKYILSVILVYILMISQTQASNLDLTDPYQSLNQIAKQTLDNIKANKDKVTDKAFMQNLIKQDLIPYVDVRYAAYKVIGTSLKNTTEAQRNEFTQAFETYLISTFAEVLGKYDKQELELAPYRKVDNTKESIINIKYLIKEEGKQDLELIFKLRRNNNTNEWRVFDMVAENISMLQAKQSELGPIIRDKGIDEAIKLLKAKQ